MSLAAVYVGYQVALISACIGVVAYVLVRTRV